MNAKECAAHTSLVMVVRYKKEECRLNNLTTDEECKKIISTVEQWLKEHPHKTRQSEFLKMFPNASVIANGTLGICPKSLDKDRECFYSDNYDNNKFVDCLSCRNQFWLEEVE